MTPRSAVVTAALRLVHLLDRIGLRRLRLVRRLTAAAGALLFRRRRAVPGLSAMVEVAGARVLVPKATAGPYLRRGGFEPLTSEVLETTLQPGQTVVDVGANIGLHTVRMARRVGPRGRVHALEPGEENLAYLRENLRRNRLENVRVLAVAAAAERGTRAFYLQPRSTHHSFHARSDSPGTLVNVEAAPLDELIDGPVDLVKIDTEGSEVEVILGMKRLLRESPNVRLVVEWNLPLALEQSEGPEELPTLLVELGFAVAVLDEEARRPTTVAEVLDRLRQPSGERLQVVNLLAERVP